MVLYVSASLQALYKQKLQPRGNEMNISTDTKLSDTEVSHYILNVLRYLFNEIPDGERVIRRSLKRRRLKRILLYID